MYNKVISSVLSAHISAQGTKIMTEQRYAPREDKPVEYGEQQDGDKKTVFNPEAAKKNRRTVGKLAAGLALAGVLGGGGYAMGHRGDPEAPRPQPTASAGVAPGEVTSEPTPEATGVDTTLGWTSENFPYDLEGKIYNGEAELEAAYGIKVSDYPDGAAAGTQLIKDVNLWINSIDTEKDNKVTYKDYSDVHRARNAAVADNLVAPAWEKVLTTDGGGVADPQIWMNTLKGLHLDNIQKAAQQRARGEGDDHYAGFKVNEINVHAAYQNEVSMTFDLTFQAPDRQVELYLHVTLKQVKGADGEMCWKVISASDEEK